MVDDPDTAYAAAKAARAKRLQTDEQEKVAAASLPERAEQRLSEFIEPIKAMIPAGLTADIKITPAGGIPDGVKGLFFILKEDGKDVAQGAISCDTKEIVHFVGFAPHDPLSRSQTPQAEMGKIQLALLKETDIKRFLREIITKYIQ